MQYMRNSYFSFYGIVQINYFSHIMPQFHLTLLPIFSNYHYVPSHYFFCLDPTHEYTEVVLALLCLLLLHLASRPPVLHVLWQWLNGIPPFIHAVYCCPRITWWELRLFPSLCYSISHSLNVQVSLHIISLHIISFLWTYNWSSSF